MRRSMPRLRTSGSPPSANGASSMHLRWEFPGAGSSRDPFVGATATLEVAEPPATPDLYFWALQATFADSRRDHGGGHVGLQWHSAYPGSTAVNWGGYASSGHELDGSESALASTLSNPNTRDFRWAPRRPYRLEVAAAAPGAWQASVTDGTTGTTTVVRDLYCAGDRLTGLVVWSEVFARCDAPRVTVRWNALSAMTRTGRVLAPAAVVASYQSYADGGCDNTDATLDESRPGTVLQMTNTPRSVPAGSVLRLR